MITKTIAVAVSTLLVAAGTLAEAANAGGCHGGGHRGFGLRTYQSGPSPAYMAQLRARKAAEARAAAVAQRKREIAIAQAAAARRARAAEIASAAKVRAEAVASAAKTVTEPAAKAEEAKAEPATAETSETKAEVNVATVKESCSKFIAATGTTVEVECTKE